MKTPTTTVDTAAADFWFRTTKCGEVIVLVDTAECYGLHSASDGDENAGDCGYGVYAFKRHGWARIDLARAEQLLGFELTGVHDSSTSK